MLITEPGTGDLVDHYRPVFHLPVKLSGTYKAITKYIICFHGSQSEARSEHHRSYAGPGAKEKKRTAAHRDRGGELVATIAQVNTGNAYYEVTRSVISDSYPENEARVYSFDK